MSDRDFLEAGVDFDRANAARMYDYYLGGAHNFAVDRDRADAVITVQPHTVFMAQANRAFLGRVVRWCLDQGIDQFLDLGSGVPTVGNVHEIAHQHQPHARVAYVDFEPVAVAHATEIIAELDTTAVTITRADARDPDSVLHAPGVADLLDFTRPVALLAVAVLQFIEGDMAALLDQYRRSLPSGSVIAISHASDDQPDPTFVEAMRSMRDAYSGSATPLVLRDRAELLAAFHDLELVDPGLVDTTEWPSPQSSAKSWMYGAVARLPSEAPET